MHRQQPNGNIVSLRVFPFVRVWFSPWFGSVLSFLVLDDAICVVGECEFLQCTVLGKHGAVSDDVTLRGWGVIFFLLKPIFTHVSRYAPGSPKPGVSKPTPTRPPALVSYVRLRAGYALQRPPVK